MSLKAFYTSDSGTRELDFTVAFQTAPDAGPASPWLAPSLREVTVTLRPGDRWPNRVRKGLPIEYDIYGHHFVGVVIRRRKEVLVMWGEFE